MKDKSIAPGLTRRGLVVSGAALGLAGCTGNLIGPLPSPQLYAVHPAFRASPDAPNAGWQLVVSLPVAPGSLDTPRIALMQAPNVMDYYANAAWTDSVPALVQTLLVEAFEKSGRIAAVGRASQGIRADYILQTEIRDFEAYYAVRDAPPKVVVKLSASLTSAMTHEVIATLRPEQEVQTSANNLVAITAAFTQATGATIDEIVDWTLRVPVPARRTAEAAAPVTVSRQRR